MGHHRGYTYRPHRHNDSRRVLLDDAVSRTLETGSTPHSRVHSDAEQSSHVPPSLAHGHHRKRFRAESEQGSRVASSEDRHRRRSSPGTPTRERTSNGTSPQPSPTVRAQATPLTVVVDTEASARTRPSTTSSSQIVLEVKLRELLKVITPTAEERHRKMGVLRDVRRALGSVGLQVNIYGSLSTGLLIPSSDIDCVLSPFSDSDSANGEQANSQRAGMPPQLERTMRNLAVAHVMSTKERKSCFSAGVRVVANTIRSSRAFRHVLPIAHAKVPIVKCEHRNEDIKVDLSFEKDGLTSSRFLCTEFQRPGNELARPLIVLVKTMIAHWGLADPSVGGLGSFPTSLMVLFFLQTEVYEKYPAELRDSLAVLLVGFLKYFGNDFDFYRLGIDYVKRTSFSKPPTNDIYIVNPIKPGTSCAKAATLYASRVVPCFQQAAKALSDVLDSHTSEAKAEAALDRFFHSAVPDCRDWRLIQRKAARYSLGAPNQWDSETHLYTGGVM